MDHSKTSEILTQLKASRTSTKGWITKRSNEIKELMTDFKNGEKVKDKSQRLHKTISDFRSAHEAYHKELTNDDEIQASIEYLDNAEQSTHAIIREIQEWLAEYELLSTNFDGSDKQPPDATSEIQPSDSVSNAGSHKGSKASHKSKSSHSSVSKATSASSLRAKAAAKKAVLQAEAAKLKKLHALEEEELRLKQQKQELEMETEIAKAEAEENALSHFETASTLDPILPIQQGIKKEPNSVKTESQTAKHKCKKSPNAKGKVSLLQVSNKGSTKYHGTSLNEELLGRMIESQRLQTDNIKQLLEQQRQHTLALMLPQPDVPTFSGNPVEYCAFVRAFESIIESKTLSERDRLYYLVQYTTGEVQELVRSCLAMAEEEGYKEARRLVKERYGQGYRIASAYIERLTKGPAIKAEDSASLRKFSISLTSCTNTLKEIGYLSKLENPDSMRKIIDKLPYGLRLKWRDTVDSIAERGRRDITIADITKFVVDRARAASHPIFGQVANHESKNSNSSYQERPKPITSTPRRTTFATQGSQQTLSSTSKPPVKCLLCQQEHWLSQCQTFRSNTISERSKFVRGKNLCGNCLVPRHFIKDCPKKSFCKVSGCTGKHSTFLHPVDGKTVFVKSDTTNNQPSERKPGMPAGNTAIKDCNNGYVEAGNALQCKSSKIALAIVPVRVKAKGQAKAVETYAFLDGGSNASFCTESLMKQINVKGKETTLSLTTMKSIGETVRCSLVELEVLDLDESHRVELSSVFSTKELPVSTENMANQGELDQWPHLRDIHISQISAKVDLLIGCDAPEALQPEEIRSGRKSDPYATKTIFCWAINGPLREDKGSTRTANAIKADLNLNHQFKEYCNMEFNDSSNSVLTAMSQEDKRALNVMDKTAELKDGHYELALPWKHDPPCLENNRCAAMHRLQLLKKRLMKDPKLLQMYKDFINTLLLKGYARKVPVEGLGPAKATWYLPHHPVFHPKKPDKVRVVFDCSAKYKGTSLNDQLLQGPDLTNSLFGVLTRF